LFTTEESLQRIEEILIGACFLIESKRHGTKASSADNLFIQEDL